MSARRPLALVTGGVKRLGAAIAGALADAGYELTLSSHEQSPGDPDDRRLIDAAVRTYHCDLSSADAPGRLIDAVTRDFGRPPDLLVNNSAIFGQDDWRQMSAATLDAHMAVNLRGPLLLSQALAKALPEDGTANIVHIVDQRVRNPIPQQISYTLSKQALAASIRTLARALGPAIRVNGVAPGLTVPNPEHSTQNVAATRAAMPLQSLPEPGDIAGAVLFLAKARAVTGQLVFVDCGAHLKSFDSDFDDLE